MIGPDEYHEHVDNNAYTNRLAQWNLQTALELLQWAKEHTPEKASELIQRLDLTAERLAKWQDVIDTNLGGCFNMAKAVFEGMTARGYGRIVNIGSINGQAGQYGQVNYAAAKSGIHGFTKALAQEGARNGVTVNAIAPGYIDTDMVAAVPEEVLGKIVARIPVNRLGRADEIARGVAFLVDENAGFVTGSTLSINGGQHMY